MEEALFAAMERNALHVSDFFKLPSDSVVEIGREVAIQSCRCAPTVQNPRSRRFKRA